MHRRLTGCWLFSHDAPAGPSTSRRPGHRRLEHASHTRTWWRALCSCASWLCTQRAASSNRIFARALPGFPVSTEHLPRPEVVTLGLYGNPRRRPPTFTLDLSLNCATGRVTESSGSLRPFRLLASGCGSSCGSHPRSLTPGARMASYPAHHTAFFGVGKEADARSSNPALPQSCQKLRAKITTISALVPRHTAT